MVFTSISWSVFQRCVIPVISRTPKETETHRSCCSLEFIVLTDWKLGLYLVPWFVFSCLLRVLKQGQNVRWTERVNAWLLPLRIKILTHHSLLPFMALRLQATLTACSVTAICNRSCPRYSRSWGTKTWSSLPPVTQYMSIKAGKQKYLRPEWQSSAPSHMRLCSLSRGNVVRFLNRKEFARFCIFYVYLN